MSENLSEKSIKSLNFFRNHQKLSILLNSVSKSEFEINSKHLLLLRLKWTENKYPIHVADNRRRIGRKLDLQHNGLLHRSRPKQRVSPSMFLWRKHERYQAVGCSVCFGIPQVVEMRCWREESWSLLRKTWSSLQLLIDLRWCYRQFFGGNCIALHPLHWQHCTVLRRG